MYLHTHTLILTLRHNRGPAKEVKRGVIIEFKLTKNDENGLREI